MTDVIDMKRRPAKLPAKAEPSFGSSMSLRSGRTGSVKSLSDCGKPSTR
jgi:hypothetical protein